MLERTKGKSSQSSRMGLPAELRTRIYTYALYEKRGVMISKAGGVSEPALLRASKTVPHEALGIYYTVNTVGVVIDSFDFTVDKLLSAKIRALARTYGGFRLPMLMVHYPGIPNWKCLENGLRMHHEDNFFRTGTLDTKRQLSAGRPELKVIYGMIAVVRAMKSSKWEDVEQTLELLRSGLIAIDQRWATNRWHGA